MIRIPYGKSFIEYDEGGAPVLTSRIGELKAAGSGVEIVRAAMAEPIDSPRLRELARGKKNCVVIVSDHTRPVPSRDILPPMLEELRAGSPDIEVTLLVATGFHRPTSMKELEDKLGKEIMESCRVVVHDCRDGSSNVEIGTLPSGAPCVIDRLAVETELLVAEGFIEPHFFAGFSGGRKSVLPGVADQVTVLGNHCSRFIDSPFARTGVLDGNPIHEDMLFAARAARLAFVVNVVIDAAHEPIFSVAGDCDAAHRAGRAFLAEKCQVNAVPADIAVSTNGGYPLDQNIYQAVKGMTAAEATVKPGGVIVMFAKAADGHGGASFHRTFRDEPDLDRMMRTFLSRRPEETIIDQWQSQILARVLLKAKVIFVSACDDQIVRDLHMIPAHSAEEAMAKAKELVGKADYQVTVIPDGVAVIVKEP